MGSLNELCTTTTYTLAAAPPITDNLAGQFGDRQWRAAL
jgi:hypothetical protein